MEDKKNYLVTEVFTPASPAKFNFVEREDLNKRIVRALRTTGNQIVIYGYTGSGKSTLIEQKLLQTYSNHVKTSCMKDMSYESVILDAFDKLSPFYVNKKTASRNTSITSSLSAQYASIQASLGESQSEDIIRALPPQLTGQNLAQLMGAADACWVLEDFHKLPAEDKTKLAQLMKVFMDASNDYHRLKMVLVGAEATARQVVQYDAEMKHRVSEIHVPLMSKIEVSTILMNGFEFLNLGIQDESIITEAFDHSSGVPAIAHKLGLLMCEHLDVNETLPANVSTDPYDHTEIRTSVNECDHRQNLNTRKLIRDFGSHRKLDGLADGQVPESGYNFQELVSSSGVMVTQDSVEYALQEYRQDQSDTVLCAFERALKHKHGSILIEALSQCGVRGGKLKTINENLLDIDARSSKLDTKKALSELCSEKFGSVVRYHPDSDLYSFSDPFHRSFASSCFAEESADKELSSSQIQNVMRAWASSSK